MTCEVMDIVLIISNFLSIITISLCLVLKLPQIISIYRLKSADGISLLGLMLELCSYTTMASYNFCNHYALLSYMEYPVIIVQEIVLIFFVLKYKQLLGLITAALFGLYVAVTCGFLYGIIAPTVLTYMVPLSTPVSLSSKVIQLWEIVSKRNADSVSITTWIISASTNMSRIFTIYMDSADALLLVNFTLSTILSSSIAVAAFTLQRVKKDY